MSEFSVPPAGAGEYDYTSEQVAAFKQLIKHADETGGGMIGDQIAADVVVDLLVTAANDYHEETMKESNSTVIFDEETKATHELLKNPRVVNMIAQAAFLGASWRTALNEGVATQGDAWTPDTAPAGFYMQTMLEGGSVADLLQGANRNHPDGQRIVDLYEAVVGKPLEVEEPFDGFGFGDDIDG